MKYVADLARKSIKGFNSWNPAKQDLFVKLAFNILKATMRNWIQDIYASWIKHSA